MLWSLLNPEGGGRDCGIAEECIAGSALEWELAKECSRLVIFDCRSLTVLERL